MFRCGALPCSGERFLCLRGTLLRAADSYVRASIPVTVTDPEPARRLAVRPSGSVTDNCHYVDNMMFMTDTRNVTVDGHQDRGTNLVTASRHTCSSCRRDVRSDEPLYRMLPRTRGLAYCAACWAARYPGSYASEPFHVTPAAWGERREWDDPGWDGLCRCAARLVESYSGIVDGEPYSRCEGCGRLLGRTNYWPESTCSDECAQSARNQRRRVARTERRCEECESVFTPPRADTKYCSSACRQKAYRSRVAAEVPERA